MLGEALFGALLLGAAGEPASAQPPAMPAGWCVVAVPPMTSGVAPVPAQAQAQPPPPPTVTVTVGSAAPAQVPPASMIPAVAAPPAPLALDPAPAAAAPPPAPVAAPPAAVAPAPAPIAAPPAPAAVHVPPTVPAAAPVPVSLPPPPPPPPIPDASAVLAAARAALAAVAAEPVEDAEVSPPPDVPSLGARLADGAPLMLARIDRGPKRAVERLLEPSGEVVLHEVDRDSGLVRSCTPVGSLHRMQLLEQRPGPAGATVHTVRDESGALLRYTVGNDGEPRGVVLVSPAPPPLGIFSGSNVR